MTIDEYRTKSAQGGFDTTGLSDAEVFLNPKSFQAVARVEGWHSAICVHSRNWSSTPCDNVQDSAGEIRMRRLVDALIEGKTIEEYLATL